MRALQLAIAIFVVSNFSAVAAPLYSLVQGIDKFDGSPRAWHLLETNGFVVADPAYKEIFEPYLDTSLPPFITTDSAWQTYQVLLAQGVKQMYERQIQFHSTTSGLEFLMAHSETRSPAAERALRQLSGDQSVQALKNLNPPLPSNSLAAESLRLLATLQQPLPDRLAPAFHSDAWPDKQLWTQLAGCVGKRHSNQPPSETPHAIEPGQEWPKRGVVAPYPDFFASLAKLSRETAEVMEKSGIDEPFNARALARKMLDGILIDQEMMGQGSEETVEMSREHAELNRFFIHYSETRQAGENAPAAQQLLKDLEAVARRCLNGGVPSDSDMKVLSGLFDQRLTAPRLLHDFAGACDRLSELARDYRDGKPMNDDDEKWMTGYGLLLAGYGTDDLSAVRALGTNSAGNSTLWAGLGQPEALYIILPAEGRLQLYRGAVITYREFIRPASNSVDDKSWQQLVESGNAPPPPVFTASFRAEKSAVDILDTLASEARDAQGYQEIQQSLEALQSRVKDGDLPALIDALGKKDNQLVIGFPEGIAAAIAKLNWKSWQQQLLALVDADEGIHAVGVVSVLLQHPEWIDAAYLNANFARGSPRSRRVFTLLLGRAGAADQTHNTLLRALRDDSPGVRWQSVLAVGDASWDVAEKTSPLVERLGDSNEFVAAIAAVTLGKIGATNAAPVLFTNLEERLKAPRPDSAAIEEQIKEVREDFPANFNRQSDPFDPGNLLVLSRMGRMRRFAWDNRGDTFTVVTALVEALGELDYQPAKAPILGLIGGPNSTAAATALKKIAPAELTKRLLNIAGDKNAQAQSRDEALILLGDAPGASASDLVSLLDDRTVIPGPRPMPGRDWRICDRAAMTLAGLLGRSVRLGPMMPTEERDIQINQVRQWLKSAY
ncbi:MAG TPA: DUF3160 domain-containing protein [Verrucomicrobiae bacterium]|jgi:hypothetical protein|nr:DUF3160 domain-containing protein [Verrucomicrobiae bacterium]